MLLYQFALGVANDVVDVEHDLATKPWKPVAQGAISRRGATLLAAGLARAGMLITSGLDLLPWLIGVAGLGCGLVYDVQLKRTPLSFPLGGCISVDTGVGLAPPMPGCAPLVDVSPRRSACRLPVLRQPGAWGGPGTRARCARPSAGAGRAALARDRSRSLRARVVGSPGSAARRRAGPGSPHRGHRGGEPPAASKGAHILRARRRVRRARRGISRPCRPVSLRCLACSSLRSLPSMFRTV